MECDQEMPVAKERGDEPREMEMSCPVGAKPTPPKPSRAGG